MQPGAKRPPSSLVQATTSIGRRALPGVVQGGQRLQSGDHPVDAVEAAAVRLGVHVAAGDHGGGARFGALAAEPEVGGGIDRDRGADLLGPADQQPARLTIEFGQAGAVDAIAWDGANPCHCHQAVPLPLLVHADSGFGCHRGLRVQLMAALGMTLKQF